MSLFDLLMEHPFDDGEALVHTLDGSLSKVEVIQRVDALEGELRPHCEGANRIAVVADGIDALVGMFACWAGGNVYVPINPRQPVAAIDAAIDRTKPAAVVRDGHTESLDTDTAPDEPGAAFLLWTSGTTGEPKPVLHTHEAYLELIDRVLAPLRARPANERRTPSPNLIPVSMALNAGIYNALFGLRAGAPLVLMKRFTTAAFAELVRRHQIRSTVLPPAAMAMLNVDLGVESLAPLKYVRSITAPLSPFQARRFTKRFDAFVLNGYGQAETGEVIGWTAVDAKEHPDRIGAVGRAHAGVDVRIDEPDTNGVGELLVRPPNTAVGLAPDRTTGDGFVRTGDLARIDDADFVWIEGRRSDLINRGGNKVFPDEVEEVLAAIEGVRDVAVFAASDDRLGEVPMAAVVGDASDSDLDAAVRSHLAAYKAPTVYHRVQHLPRSDVGKVLRRQLREDLTGRTRSDSRTAP